MPATLIIGFDIISCCPSRIYWNTKAIEVTHTCVFKRIPWKTQWPRQTTPALRADCIYIGMGTNIGTPSQRRRILQLALHEINSLPTITVRAVSSLYNTPPWGITDQPDFYNIVIAITGSLRPAPLLFHLKQIEIKLGRRKRRRWGPREIDLDILLYQDLRYRTPTLTIPHKHLNQRPFVTIPLMEIAGNRILPHDPSR